MQKVLKDKAVSIIGDKFDIVASSIIGASHIRKNIVCQDALLCSTTFFRGEEIVISIVSDGHGGSKYIYSDIGSELATEAVYNNLLEFAKWIIENRLNKREINLYFKEKLIKSILIQWHKMVLEDYAKRDNNSNYSTYEIIKFYGCTISFALIVQENIYSGQIGDGAIYNYDYGVDVKIVLPNVESENLGLVTDSLCNENAIYKYQYSILPLKKRKKGVLLISTDGLLDSLEDNIIEMLQDLYLKRNKFGLETIRKLWPKMLRKWTEDGVGDDMGTILIFYGKSNQKKRVNYFHTKKIKRKRRGY